MKVLWPIAYITLKEGIRNRAIYGISLFAFLLLGLNMLIANLAPRDVGKVAVDIALSTISFSGLLIVLFVAINLMAKDLDKKTIHMVLSKPISRSEYIWGKFFGIALILVLTVIFISIFAALSLYILKAGYESFFLRFSWPLVFLAIFFIVMSLILLSALSLLFASFSSTSFITLVLTILTYLVGRSLSDIKALIETASIAGATVSPITAKVVEVAYYIFPNFAFFDIKMNAAHGLSVPIATVFWTVLYCLIYGTLALTAASLVFRRKEFP